MDTGVNDIDIYYSVVLGFRRNPRNYSHLYSKVVFYCLKDSKYIFFLYVGLDELINVYVYECLKESWWYRPNISMLDLVNFTQLKDAWNEMGVFKLVSIVGETPILTDISGIF